MGKILIASDSITAINSLEAKLVLLRESDTIFSCETAQIQENITNTDIILLHVANVNEATLETIKKIKKQNNIVICVVEEFNPKTILQAYDLGVSNFCSLSITNFELLINIINAKKELKQIKKLETFRNILRDKELIKRNSDIYTSLDLILNAELYGNIINCSMLALNINDENNSDILPQTLRDTDFVINYKPSNYLVILPNTDVNSGSIIFEKLHQKLNDLSGVLFKYKEEGILDLLKRIEHLEFARAQQNLDLYIEDETDFSEESESDWLNENLDLIPEQKNFKLFQNIYNQKAQKVIEPVFYRTKQKFDGSLKNTKIKYITDENNAEFMLINFDSTNTFKILFRNRATVTITAAYSGLNSPENEKFELPFSKLTVRKLTELLENFIKKGKINA